jgi:VanZ family protein
MNKQIKKFIRYWFPPIVLVVTIFFSSSQSYEKQDLRPKLERYLDMQTVKQLFFDVKFDYAGKEISVANLGPAGFIEFFIRKLAHFVTNFLLGFLLYRALVVSRIEKRRRLMFAIGMVALFAAMDEAHQMLTPNRTPLFADVVLDSIGGWLGIGSFLVIHYWYTRNSLLKKVGNKA